MANSSLYTHTQILAVNEWVVQHLKSFIACFIGSNKDALLYQGQVFRSSCPTMYGIVEAASSEQKRSVVRAGGSK